MFYVWPSLLIAPLSLTIFTSLFTYYNYKSEYVKLYEGIPAYSLILLKLAINLRIVIVTTAVHRGFGRQLFSFRRAIRLNQLP